MAKAGEPDPYEIRSESAGAVRAANGAQASRRGSSPGSVLLWTLAAIFAGTNTALSISGHEIIGAVFGSAAVICLIVLLVRYLRRRR